FARRNYSGFSVDQEQLAEDFRPVCGRAREHGLRSERLIILLKEVWFALPLAVSTLADRDHSDLLSQVVSTVIHEFYRADALELPSSEPGELPISS
ncbi:MAG: hypothetical protein M3Y05_02280, partial [Gemmatimonadota bacterium]|nr:hypothetical protein [Gemmatimonadota bacterium]